MLKSPKKLQATSKRATETQAAQTAKSAAEFEKLKRLQREFESACLDASFRRRTHIFFDHEVSKATNLQGFTVEEFKRDHVRQNFLASKVAETQQRVDHMLEGLAGTHPTLVTDPFPNRVARDFRDLLNLAIDQTTAEDVVAFIKAQLCLVTSPSKEIWQTFEPVCLGLASEGLILQAARIKHAKVAKTNAAIPDGLSSALKISWDAANPFFGKANEFSPHKLKWIAMIWPKWESYFNNDIEDAASSGLTSKEWLFWSAQYWGENDSFAVDTKHLPKPDTHLMSEEERQIYFYWEEIKERDRTTQRFDENQGALIGVHPLPVAELFHSQGYQVTVEELGDEDEDGNITSRQINIVDLDECSVDLTYRLKVSWNSV